MEALWVMAGVIIGSIITNIIFFVRTAGGTLQVDHSNPEKDVYRLNIDDLDRLDKKKRVWLRVDHNADLSQK